MRIVRRYYAGERQRRKEDATTQRRKDARDSRPSIASLRHCVFPSPYIALVPNPLTDITIIGAGPTGLFGAFYAGMRGASCRIIDALPALGGQLLALYPEKFIFDVAGFRQVLAKDLVREMTEQALQFGCEVRLHEGVTRVSPGDEGGGPRPFLPRSA